MKLFKNKRGMSLFYVIIMMAVVMALSSMMLSAALYNNTLVKLTEYKFETRRGLDLIGEDFINGDIIKTNISEYDTIYEILWFSETVTETGIIVKENNVVLLTVKKIDKNITSWVYGEEKIR